MPVKPFAATVTDNRLHSGVCRQSLGFGRWHKPDRRHQIVREYSTIRPVTS